jgi:hypothetical protein
MTAPTPPPVLLRDPSMAFLVAFLFIVFVVGLGGATFLAGQGRLQAPIAEGLAIPAALATSLSAVLAGVHLRRGLIKSRLSVALRTAAAWGVTGAVWPLSNGVADLILSNPHGSLLGMFTLVLLGAVIGATAGLAAGAAGAFVATK